MQDGERERERFVRFVRKSNPVCVQKLCILVFVFVKTKNSPGAVSMRGSSTIVAVVLLRIGRRLFCFRRDATTRADAPSLRRRIYFQLSLVSFKTCACFAQTRSANVRARRRANEQSGRANATRAFRRTDAHALGANAAQNRGTRRSWPFCKLVR